MFLFCAAQNRLREFVTCFGGSLLRCGIQHHLVLFPGILSRDLAEERAGPTPSIHPLGPS